MNSYHDPCTRYAQDVIEGKITAGRLVRLACERHLRDLKRQGTPAFPYVWEPHKAERIYRFASLLRHPDGALAGQYIKLSPFQCFIVGSIFGWIHASTGYRRFKKAYVSTARKNSKSFLVALIGLYMMLCDEWQGAQVYAAATHRDQAKITWGYAVRYVELSPSLSRKLTIRHSRPCIEYKGNTFRPLSRDINTLDGFNPHAGLIDEFHAHKTNQMVKLLEDGTVLQTQPLIFIITTAGFDLSTPCYEEYNYCKKILEGSITNEEYFTYIAEIDEEDNPFDERVWPKANPLLLDVPQMLDALRRLSQEAQDKGGDDLKDFLTKSMNRWIDHKPSGYIDPDKWKACSGEIPPLKDKECFIGLDLSAKIDLTSVTFEFPIDDKFIILSHSFMPEETLQRKMKTDKVPYDIWAQEGWITITPGAVVDYRFVRDWILKEISSKGYVVKEICFDPWSALQIANDFIDEGYNAIEIVQGMKTLSEPTKHFRDCVYAQRIIHDNNPVLAWAISNAVTRKDHNENIMLDKSKSSQRIDPLAATINAHVRALHRGKEPEYYTGWGFVV